MKKIGKVLIWILGIVAVIYVAGCIWFYSTQEKVLFDTSAKLAADHVFQFTTPFEERSISMEDGKKLNGVLFRAEDPKGLILYLPGGRGMIDSIGVNASVYTDLHYDFFVLNYRGFGKSEGNIKSEKQFDQDIQTVYDYFKKEYGENNMVVIGYSLGSGMAAALASANHPRMLILEAPYYSMSELTRNAFPYLPVSLLLKYKYPTNEYLTQVKSPVVIIHGESDKRIPAQISRRLKESLKPTDELIIINGQGHNNFEQNEEYKTQLARILE